MKAYVWCVCKISVMLLTIQIFRISFIQVLMEWLPYNIASILVMSILLFFCILYIKVSHINVQFFPFIKHRWGLFFYVLISMVALLLVIFLPGIQEQWISIIYACLLIALFEELLFRGCIWRTLKDCEMLNGMIILVTTVLFMFWHVGYMDSFMINASQIDTALIIRKKMEVAFVLGLGCGILRNNFRNVYITYLLHAMWNLFAR